MKDTLCSLLLSFLLVDLSLSSFVPVVVLSSGIRSNQQHSTGSRAHYQSHRYQQQQQQQQQQQHYANNYPSRVPSSSSSSSTRRYSFFKDMINKAFENDRNLSPDKTKGQYDAPGEEFEDDASSSSRFSSNELTETQKKWRQLQLQTTTVTPDRLVGTSWNLELYLSGVPDRDPSNDLYGSKINISSRDRETGLSLPSVPSTKVTIQFLENGICQSQPSDFTSGQVDGEWKLSPDGKVLRFSLDTLGYTRTVETKGSIQKIYWTDEDEKSIQTSSTYSIPPGFVYGDIQIVSASSSSSTTTARLQTQQQQQPGGRLPEFASSGVLRLEQSTGLFGVASKLVACGKFTMKRKMVD